MPRLPLLAAVLLLGPAATAQISITRADVAALLTSPATVSLFEADASAPTLAALEALAGQTGGGQTWTFTGLPFTLASTITLAPVAPPQPGSDVPHLATATHIVRADTAGVSASPSYLYSRLTDDALVSLGVAGLDGADVVAITFVPGVSQPLPTTFGTSWTSESQVVIAPAALPFEQTTRDESAVVGWGTLVTPGGSAPALMVRSLDITRTSLTFPGLPPFESTDSTLTISFLTRGPLGATVALDVRTGAALSGDYSSAASGTATGSAPEGTGALGLTVGPNPARRGRVALYVAADAPAAVTVCDARGRTVAAFAPSRASVRTWDASAVAPGVYVIRAQTATGSATRTVVVR